MLFVSSLLLERDTVSPVVFELLFGIYVPKSSISETELSWKLLALPGVQMSLLSSFRPGVLVVEAFLYGDAPKILDTDEENVVDEELVDF
jgi:hypothetical protein